MTSSEAEAYELHYFGCARCFAQLEAARLAKKSFAAATPARRFVPWLAIAASVVFAASGLLVFRHRSPSVPQSAPPVVAAAKPNLALFAKFDPPHYEDQAMRGAADARSKRFRQAMRSYATGNFDVASSDLDRFLTTDPEFIPARFYSASAKLLAHQPERAAADFNLVVAAKDPDFTEEALWGLANAALMQNQAPRTENYLAAIARGNGVFAARAKELLTKLAQDRPQSPPSP